MDYQKTMTIFCAILQKICHLHIDLIKYFYGKQKQLCQPNAECFDYRSKCLADD